ncbi:ArdC-like ssDNA-binding domain-containing protein [Jiangella endophytica]|uniref:ArdC-like ssDNA-binding domain-containing protein n=1 Tax=Jiangella endophytica TaxID=1623398 RepID=UPI001E3A83AD|nr:ArdC-like ssDNA-binding domain-containing protein [Jiangella endophytica]
MRAIQFAAKFRSRSFGNTLLIYVQHMQAYLEGRVPEPIPTFVAGFRQWQHLGRSVNGGQSGYAILAPVTRRFATTNPLDADSWRPLDFGEKARPGEVVRTKVVGVKPAYVWDVSQTSGEPIPEQPAPRLLSGQAPEGLWDGLAAQVETAGYAPSRVDAAAIDGVNGRTDIRNRTVQVRADLDEATAVKTLAHELAHVVLHASPDGTSNVAHRGIAEVEAESVAMMIGASYGLDTAEYSVPYVSTWSDTVADAEPLQVVRATGERVRRTALAILDQLPDPPTGDGLPPGLGSPGSSATPQNNETPAGGVHQPTGVPEPGGAQSRTPPAAR